MKKFYLAPEIEEIRVNSISLLTGSPDPDTTDPVTVVTETEGLSEDDWTW